MHNFRELEVWKKSIVLCKHYYLISKNFPKDEMLTSQSRRSLYSIPSNIAEGAGRDTNPQFCQFLNMA
jgi:S23 ribosomal protein.